MSEKHMDDLPPSYTNLGFDGDPVAGPSAPQIAEEGDVLQEDLKSHAPSAPVFSEEEHGPRPLIYNPPALVFEEVYDACVKYVKRHCCYGSRFINQMKLAEISNKGVFYYTLESFGEKRESAMHYTPYKGGPIDGPENGPAPNAWDMQISPQVMFQDCKGRREIPHTASVSICRKCDGIGKVTCTSCYGRGREDCFSCSGRGRDSEGERCNSCSGSGTKTCWRCSGSGRVTCSRCDGYGKMKSCRMLLVTWKNHSSYFISDAGNLPDAKIRKANAIEMIRESYPRLEAIGNAPDPSVNEASANLLAAHGRSFPNELIIRQRHILRVVPYTRVAYQWKTREGEFFVYGTDREVYFEDYPQRCCCCTCC